MYQRGRGILAVSSQDLLYQRFRHDDIDDNRVIRDSMISAPDQSVNHAGYGGRCWHVLLPEPGENLASFVSKKLCYGVIAFRACAIPASIQPSEKADSPVFSFVVEHAPVEHNYLHCEIRIYLSGVRLTDDDAKKLKNDAGTAFRLAKKIYRSKIRKAWEIPDLWRVELEPEQPLPKRTWHSFAPLCVVATSRNGGPPIRPARDESSK